jgi:nucleotide-binding universal stress UspA family protein
MAETDAGRIVVGISAGVAGYQALRYAVAAARERQATLLVVRVFDERSPVWAPWQATLIEAAAEEVRNAFRETFGGIPRDLSIRMISRVGLTGAELTGVANRPADVLVIGGSGTHRLTRPWSGAVARYCARHATCPVVIVPPPALARCGRAARLAKAAAAGAEEFLRTSTDAIASPQRKTT